MSTGMKLHPWCVCARIRTYHTYLHMYASSMSVCMFIKVEGKKTTTMAWTNEDETAEKKKLHYMLRNKRNANWKSYIALFYVVVDSIDIILLLLSLFCYFSILFYFFFLQTYENVVASFQTIWMNCIDEGKNTGNFFFYFSAFFEIVKFSLGNFVIYKRILFAFHTTRSEC